MHVIVVTHRIQIRCKNCENVHFEEKSDSTGEWINRFSHLSEGHWLSLLLVKATWNLHMWITDFWCLNKIKPFNRHKKLKLISYRYQPISYYLDFEEKNDENLSITQKLIDGLFPNIVYMLTGYKTDISSKYEVNPPSGLGGVHWHTARQTHTQRRSRY